MYPLPILSMSSPSWSVQFSVQFLSPRPSLLSLSHAPICRLFSGHAATVLPHIPKYFLQSFELRLLKCMFFSRTPLRFKLFLKDNILKTWLWYKNRTAIQNTLFPRVYPNSKDSLIPMMQTGEKRPIKYSGTTSVSLRLCPHASTEGGVPWEQIRQPHWGPKVLPRDPRIHKTIKFWPPFILFWTGSKSSCSWGSWGSEREKDAPSLSGRAEGKPERSSRASDEPHLFGETRTPLEPVKGQWERFWFTCLNGV